MAEHGRLEQIDGRTAIRFERRLEHPIEAVWRAVTEPEQLAAWFPTTIDGERRAGAALRFRFPEDIGIEPIDGEMLSFEPPRRLAFRWGPDEIRIELTADGSGTRLVLVDLVEEHGKAARDAAGWHTCLDALGLALDGRPSREVLSTRWSEVHPYYQQEFGPEAATIGPPAEHPANRG